MAKSKKSQAEKKNASQPNAITKYLRETRGEIRKVTWPTRQESQRLTAIVVGVTVAMAVFLWFWDFVFSSGIEQLIKLLVGV